MRVSLVLVLLQWQHQVHAFQSKQSKVPKSRSFFNDVNRIDFNLCTNSVHANLGGLGGLNIGVAGPEDKTNDGEWKKELRYKKIATLPEGETLDLVVTNLTEYAANPVHPIAHSGNVPSGGEDLRGRMGCLGNINIKAPGKVQLKFALVLHGTDTPAPNNYSYDFTILDIDRSEHGMYEEFKTQRFASFAAPNIEPTKAGELFTFASPVGAKEIPNPVDAFWLTGAQLNASVGFVFENVNHWKIEASAVDPPGGIGGLEVGRNIFFAGRTSLQSDKELQ